MSIATADSQVVQELCECTEADSFWKTSRFCPLQKECSTYSEMYLRIGGLHGQPVPRS